MSAPEFSKTPRAGDWSTRFATWPGLTSLALGLVLGPIVALVNQQAIYAANMWVCGHGLRGSLHLIPALGILVVAGMAYESHRSWMAVGGGAADQDDSVATRTRFLAMLGMAISAFSALVIFAQWLGIFMFDPCVKV
ncbi:MAG: hypothetical protein JWM95_4591 [Gemmatimonadetes bacterium]|nr:hypothetical protein [Gemmatimonadota bacterium]